jgi:hypothetical protein
MACAGPASSRDPGVALVCSAARHSPPACQRTLVGSTSHALQRSARFPCQLSPCCCAPDTCFCCSAWCATVAFTYRSGAGDAEAPDHALQVARPWPSKFHVQPMLMGPPVAIDLDLDDHDWSEALRCVVLLQLLLLTTRLDVIRIQPRTILYTPNPPHAPPAATACLLHVHAGK